MGLTSNFPLLLAKLLKQDIQTEGRGDDSKSADPAAKKKEQRFDRERFGNIATFIASTFDFCQSEITISLMTLPNSAFRPVAETNIACATR